IAFKHINHANRGTTAVLFTNQVRESIGAVLKAVRDGGKVVGTGGRAPKFFSSDSLFLEHEAMDYGEYAPIPVGDMKRERRNFNGWVISVYVDKTRTTS